MTLKVFFQLIRWKNLLLGSATLILIKFILIPKFLPYSSFSNLHFVLFVLSIVFISAGGYIINDIFDVASDLINKPKRTIVGTKISKVTASKLAFSFYAIGIGLGIYTAVNIHSLYLGAYFLFLAFLLYFYSVKLKSITFLGNFTVALLISSSILMLSLFEGLKLNSILFKIIVVYAVFAFLVNLIREIVKDIEDMNGDYTLGLKTLPLVIGRKRVNSLILIISILFSIFLVVLLTLNKNLSNHLFLYGIVCVLFPLLYFIYKLNNAKSKREYTQLSLILKLIMLFGILSIFTL